MHQYVELREYQVRDYYFNLTEELVLGKIAMFFSYKHSLEKILIAKITNKSLITISTSKYSMPNYLHLTLQSERLQLIPVSLKYAEDLCKEFTAEITEHMWPSAPKTQEEINQHISEQQIKMQAGSEIALAIINKENQNF